MMKYLKSFSSCSKRASFGQILVHFLLTSGEKLNCFTFFFMELLTNYAEVILPSLMFFGLVELALQLFIRNAPKSN